ncbi:GNAT family N-acetyltransferase [Niabella hibiscisoli]|uniref:GNAT family N-acetyltransferase n=1 Tax=Niabella hibiscisoli TaxID=1825928 RepID=UPI001F0D78CE|nr:GNAT family N-acetyltransferase [Niabella hibiscisoli]MCH5715524.1 GNAT family N-acetyltransferase [Niabella hibiscisoli]
MITIHRTNSEDTSFKGLVIELDKDLAKRNGDTNDFFAQFNKMDLIKNVVVAFDDAVPVGCGAMKPYNQSAMEIKRMYVLPDRRGKGIAVSILQELEAWARELGYAKCVLETGDQMPEAIGLYSKTGYQVIPNYGPYENVKSSICFEKVS